VRRVQSPAIWGVVLVVAGVLFLVQNFGLLGAAVAIVWLLLFAAAGLAFLYIFLADRARWWAVIPGAGCLGVATLLALDRLLPAVGDVIGGSVFLAALSASFWIVYLTGRERWWAIIPGGALLSTAVVAGLENVDTGFDTGGLVLLGLGATFLLVFFVPTPQGRMKWAIFPAAVLSIIGLIVTAESAAALTYLWAVALLVVGAYLVLRGSRSQPKG
jgi:hypothetical protein